MPNPNKPGKPSNTEKLVAQATALGECFKSVKRRRAIKAAHENEYGNASRALERAEARLERAVEEFENACKE